MLGSCNCSSHVAKLNRILKNESGLHGHMAAAGNAHLKHCGAWFSLGPGEEGFLPLPEPFILSQNGPEELRTSDPWLFFAILFVWWLEKMGRKTSHAKAWHHFQQLSGSDDTRSIWLSRSHLKLWLFTRNDTIFPIPISPSPVVCQPVEHFFFTTYNSKTREITPLPSQPVVLNYVSLPQIFKRTFPAASLYS